MLVQLASRHLNDVCTVTESRQVKDVVIVLVDDVDGGAGLQEHLHHLQLILGGSHHEGGVPLVVPQVDVGAAVEISRQKIYYYKLTGHNTGYKTWL